MQHITHANVTKTIKNCISDGLKFLSLILFWLCCAKWGESTGRWRGAGPARVWSGGAWPWQHLGQPPWAEHHQSWSLKSLAKPFEGKEDGEEIKDVFLYWEAVKKGVAKLAQNVPKRNGKLLQGDQGSTLCQLFSRLRPANKKH